MHERVKEFIVFRLSVIGIIYKTIIKIWELYIYVGYSAKDLMIFLSLNCKKIFIREFVPRYELFVNVF